MVDLGVDWITAVAGSICFVIGGLIEVIHNAYGRLATQNDDALAVCIVA